MNKTTNIFETITIISSMFGIYISVQDIQSYLSITCTIICLISGLITLLCRVLAMFKKYTSDDSDGGKSLTSDELNDIANTIESGMDNLKAKDGGKKNDNNEDSK